MVAISEADRASNSLDFTTVILSTSSFSYKFVVTRRGSHKKKKVRFACAHSLTKKKKARSLSSRSSPSRFFLFMFGDTLNVIVFVCKKEY